MNKFYKPFLSFSRIFHRSVLNQQTAHNLRLKVFPERILLDTRQIENIWRKGKDNSVLNKFLYSCYVQNSELLSYAVNVIQYACSRRSASPSLVFEIVKTFGDYTVENNISLSPTLEQKIEVLSSVLSFKNYQLIQLVCNVFKLHDEPHIFSDFIKKLISDHKFSEASYFVSALHLQKEYDFREVLLPLLFDGGVHAATIYLTNQPDLQLEVVKFLDNCLDRENPITKETYFKPKKIFKVLSSLISIFKISLDTCPNLQFFRSKGAVNLLIKRRIEQSVSDATWEEMIKNIVQDNVDLQKHLVQKLIYKNDKKTALKMAEIYKINISDMHFPAVQSDTEESFPDLNGDVPEESGDSQNFDLCDISDEYLQFTLSHEDIKIIDNKVDFLDCIDDITQNYTMVGIDSEWKPHFGLSRDRLALIQIAVHDKVYILDLLLLSKCLIAEDWDRLLDDIFGNPNLIKLGCGIISDVNMILESIKGSKGKAVKFSHILDMALFYEKLRDVYPVEMHTNNDKAFGRGLSSLCEIILGKPLNKEDRLCDWEKRPLMEKQLEYAALDAHCLLLMYDKLKEEAVLKEMNFDHLAKVAIVITTSQWKPKRKFKGVKGSEAFQVQHSLPIEQLKVVMDSTFEKHGKELRKLGADVVILEDVNSADKAVELSKTEGRIVVCSERLYHQIKYRVKKGFCFFFHSSTDSEFEVSQFLQHFNAQLSTKSIFSRCLNCNSKQGVKLSPADIKIIQEFGDTSSSINSKLIDNLSSFSSDLQTILLDILDSDVSIKILPRSSSSHVNDFAFLCKNCGCIS